MQNEKNRKLVKKGKEMKVLKNLLKFIFITILTICMISLGIITITFSTILDKNFVIQKLEETDFYADTYKLVKSNFENYIYQSGLDEEVLSNICTEEKVKQDINIMLSNIYNGTNQEIDTTEIANNLNANIDKSGVKNKQNESAIQQFVAHICDEYTNTLVHTKYETQINNMYQKATEALNQIYEIILIVLAVDIIAIIAINNKKISKDLQHLGIALFATSTFELSVWQIITSKIDIQGIKIFNDVFSKSIVTIIQEILNQVASLAWGTLVISIIFIAIYVAISVNKKSTKKDESNPKEAKEA